MSGGTSGETYEVSSHDALVPVALLAHIRAEEDGQTFLEHRDTSILQHLLVHINIRDGLPVPDVAEVIDSQEAIVLVARIIHEREELLDVGGFGEFDGSHGDGLQLVGGVVELPGEFLVCRGRWAETEGDDAHNVLHHAFL